MACGVDSRSSGFSGIAGSEVAGALACDEDSVSVEPSLTSPVTIDMVAWTACKSSPSSGVAMVSVRTGSGDR